MGTTKDKMMRGQQAVEYFFPARGATPSVTITANDLQEAESRYAELTKLTEPKEADENNQ